jgi:drug/metabolite transporter (DMT)-like permease
VTPRVTAPVPARAWLPGFCALALIWGASFLFIKVGVSELHPLYVTLGRVTIGALTLLVVLIATRDRLPRDPRLWGHMALVGVFGTALPFTLFAYGEQRVSSTLAGIWNATTPLVVLPLAVWIFHTERMTWRRATGLAMGFVGVLVILGVWQGVGGSALTGQLMCLGAATCYGVAIPYFKRYVAAGAQSGVAISTMQLITASVALLVVAPVVAGLPPAPAELSADVVFSILTLGALGTGLAFVLNTRNIRLAGASTASTVTYVIPVVATIVGVLVLDERLTWYQPAGAAIVLAGVAVAQGAFRRRAPGVTPVQEDSSRREATIEARVACEAAAIDIGAPRPEPQAQSSASG